LIARRLLAAGLVVVVFGACAHAGPAQVVLEDLAESTYSERMAAGAATVVVGVAIGVASAVFLMDTELGIYGLIAGGVIAAPGVVLLLSPGLPEQEFARCGTSEAESASALERLADGGRRGRILSGITNLAAGVASVVYPINVITPYDSLYSAIASLGMAIYDFLVPSREEAAYNRYVALVARDA
jgi:hypothetical protein